MEKMKALVFKDIGKLVPEERAVPHVNEPDEVVIKVSRVGICGTDVKIMEGKHHFRPNTYWDMNSAVRSWKSDPMYIMSRSVTVCQWTTTSAVDSVHVAAWD